MPTFFTKAIIFSILIWVLKYSDKISIYRKSWNKEYNRNNIFNAQFTRLLSSETKVKEERKRKMLKKGTKDLLYESDDSSVERPNSLEHNNDFRKIFTNLMQRDISELEFNDLMKYTKIQKQQDSFNTEQNLKKKYNDLKHYDNVQTCTNAFTPLKNEDLKNQLDLFQNYSSNSHHYYKHQDMVKSHLYIRKGLQLYFLFNSKKKLIKILLALSTLIILCISIALSLNNAKLYFSDQLKDYAKYICKLYIQYPKGAV
ncbi:Plasmodium exported protein, unknown function [Plasmodium malariae]|uniref:Uncharacterized protein n=1 Tax=Plasmodium malariae TaxID=5858 RepID=A0A1D3JHT6_PLAMA|nr:Plasmodium exported protein, unknown function [Plasmodium malariae]SBT85970.1 Plasmodium exported protein, unknown function [Plasmodium malariae]